MTTFELGPLTRRIKACRTEEALARIAAEIEAEKKAFRPPALIILVTELAEAAISAKGVEETIRPLLHALTHELSSPQYASLSRLLTERTRVLSGKPKDRQLSLV